MKISFHGAARTVTGSKHVITLKNGKKILLDCGLFQGMGKHTEELNAHFGFDPAEINYLILSHAHIDHSGLIPKLVKEGFKGNIYATEATAALAEILLEDSAEIQRDDTKFINKRRAKKGLPPYEPLYDLEDAAKAIELFTFVPYREWVKIDEDIAVCFTDAGHIIGSAAVHLRIIEEGKTNKITFSGDVGRYNDAILKSPETYDQADYIILESTYGNKLHDEVFGIADTLLKWIVSTCLEKKGKLIIPAFSVGRTQELLYALNQLDLEKRLPPVPVYVDSPLSREATQLLKQYPENFNKRVKKIMEQDNDPFDFKELKFIKTVDESKALNEDGRPCVIISASGMADAGRVKHHIMNNIEKDWNTILIVGYCDPFSLGGQLTAGKKEVKIFGELYPVKAEVGVMRSMSAHGDYEDLCQFLACQNSELVRKLFLVHGEYDVQIDFAARLRRKHFKEVVIPDLHETYLLD
ncbi:MBL fold metallo-hydrolase [Sediminibacterium sp. TEGAF015]|uniref:MBL fold metallo-hydrolase n=1 Tax=Sediminibacterium sp. TEGAF015 TaxID=575378 RepID=UPI00220466D4|nr:MBL fold metallo-hydrolase [Sediminibacterium sp. TEGAF015]BDQ12009.1 MBL fold hydrolase [Sediminibacterium sp. TEGAF015]